MKIKRPSNLLYFELCMPFIHIHTSIMNYSCYEDIYEYIAFHFKIYKWNFSIRYGLPRRFMKEMDSKKR